MMPSLSSIDALAHSSRTLHLGLGSLCQMLPSGSHLHGRLRSSRSCSWRSTQARATPWSRGIISSQVRPLPGSLQSCKGMHYFWPFLDLSAMSDHSFKWFVFENIVHLYWRKVLLHHLSSQVRHDVTSAFQFLFEPYKKFGMAYIPDWVLYFVYSFSSRPSLYKPQWKFWNLRLAIAKSYKFLFSTLGNFDF